MPADVMKNLLSSSKAAQIEDIALRPKQHPIIRDTLLSVQRGQAEVYYLESTSGEPWLIKDFHANKSPDSNYLEAISSILPNQKAFRCGTERKVLEEGSLKKNSNTFYSAQLAKWLSGTVLMPQIDGTDWADLIEQIRNKQITLSPTDKISLCRNLAEIIRILEQNDISHRDLSNGNIFINPGTYEVSLIDFDGLYHPNLSIPAATTAGSEGYTAPFVDLNDITSTFRCWADRFAMTTLCVEFLTLNSKAPYAHEGGIFDQQDIYDRNGKTISYAMKELRKNYSKAADLFDQAVNSTSFENCPAPDDWIDFCRDSGCCFSVTDMPLNSLSSPKKFSAPSIEMPKDPWQKKIKTKTNKKKGKKKNGTTSKSDRRRKPSNAGSNRYANNVNHSKSYLREMENSPTEDFNEFLKSCAKNMYGPESKSVCQPDRQDILRDGYIGNNHNRFINGSNYSGDPYFKYLKPKIDMGSSYSPLPINNSFDPNNKNNVGSALDIVAHANHNQRWGSPAVNIELFTNTELKNISKKTGRKRKSKSSKRKLK